MCRTEVGPAAAHAVLLPLGMDDTFFGLKRAYHGTLRIGRERLAKLGLTAARFDLLFALTDDGIGPASSTYQSVLRRILGVTRPTVSRMMISLEKLGLVRRRKSLVDRRQLEVELTKDGWSVFRRAFEHCTTSMWAFGRLAAGLSGVERAWEEYDEPVYEQIEALDDVLTGLRRAFEDFATLRYPPMPED